MKRLARVQAGSSIATSLLFNGCRHPDHDWFYRDYIERWRSAGVVEPYLAFSAVPEQGCRYVQNLLWNANA